MGWLDLLAVQGTLKSLLHHQSSKASILQCSAFFIVQLSHSYMTTGKTITLARRTFVGKVMSLLFTMLSRMVISYGAYYLFVIWSSDIINWQLWGGKEDNLLILIISFINSFIQSMLTKWLLGAWLYNAFGYKAESAIAPALKECKSVGCPAGSQLRTGECLAPGGRALRVCGGHSALPSALVNAGLCSLRSGEDTLWSPGDYWP